MVWCVVFRVYYALIACAISSVVQVRKILYARKHLSAIKRQDRVEYAQSFSQLCGVTIVTGGKTVVLYYNPVSKRESMKKLLAKIFLGLGWHSSLTLITAILQLTGHIMQQAYSGEETWKAGQRGAFSAQQCSRTHSKNQDAIRECCFQQIDHPPYTPDIPPSHDFTVWKCLPFWGRCEVNLQFGHILKTNPQIFRSFFHRQAEKF